MGTDHTSTASTTGDETSRLLTRTAVIVVSYGSPGLLESNLAQVCQNVPEARYVLVDSFSTSEVREETLAMAREHDWVVETPETNVGFGGGVNLGAARARAEGAEILLLLNPDATISRANLIRLVSRVQAEPLTLVAPVLTDSEGHVVADRTVVCLADGSMRSPRSSRPIPPGGTRPWLSGACLALSTRLFEAAGGFDERYFLYWEDVDFCARVLGAGGALMLARGATAVHDEGGTQASSTTPDQGRAKSDTYYYYNTRNRLLYAALQLERAEQRRWAATSAAAAREIVLRGGKRQLLNSRSSLRAAWAGTRDGLHLLRQVRRGESPAEGVPLIREDSDNSGAGESSKASKNSGDGESSRAGESRDAGWPEGPEGPEGPAGAASTQSPDSPESP